MDASMTHPQSRPTSIGTVVSIASARARGVSASGWIFYGLLVVGFAVRVIMMFSSVAQVDSDQAVVYLMSRHAARGELSWLYWGRPAGGTALQLIAGLAMLVFGESIVVLGIVTALCYVVVTLLVRSIANRAGGAPVGDLAGVIFWFPGLILMRLTIQDPGFYGPSLLFGLLTLWLSLSDSHRKSFRQWGTIGLCAGVAAWCSPMGFAFAIPGVAVIIWRQRSWRHIIVGMVCAAVGALPWIVYAASHRSAFTPLGGAVHAASFVTLFTRTLPSVFPLTNYDAIRLAVGIGAAATTLFSLILWIRLKNDWFGGVAVGTVLCIVALVYGSGTLLLRDSQRYSIFLMPCLAITLGWIIGRIRWANYAVLAVVPVLCTVLVLGSILRSPFGVATRFGTGAGAVNSYLIDHGVTAAYGDYWLAYRFTAAANEKITYAGLGPRRYAAYETRAASAPHTAIVVYAEQANDQTLKTDPAFASSIRTELDGYAIYLLGQRRPDIYAQTWGIN